MIYNSVKIIRTCLYSNNGKFVSNYTKIFDTSVTIEMNSITGKFDLPPNLIEAPGENEYLLTFLSNFARTYVQWTKSKGIVFKGTLEAGNVSINLDEFHEKDSPFRPKDNKPILQRYLYLFPANKEKVTLHTPFGNSAEFEADDAYIIISTVAHQKTVNDLLTDPNKYYSGTKNLIWTSMNSSKMYKFID